MQFSLRAGQKTKTTNANVLSIKSSIKRRCTEISWNKHFSKKFLSVIFLGLGCDEGRRTTRWGDTNLGRGNPHLNPSPPYTLISRPKISPHWTKTPPPLPTQTKNLYLDKERTNKVIKS